MGHLYSELAAAYGNRGEYFGRAIDHYKQAMKLDPSAGFLVEELTDLYVQAGRLSNHKRGCPAVVPPEGGATARRSAGSAVQGESCNWLSAR